MALNDEELRYKNVINTLKGLPKVNAPRNFETELMRRINSETYNEKKSFWERLFLPTRLIPSAALAVSAVVLFFILNNSNDSEDPLLMEPKIHEDVISADVIGEDDMLVIYLPVNYNVQGERSEEGYSNIAEFKDERTDTRLREGDANLYFPNNYYLINKEGLNFRQVNLTKEEQQRLIELKEHFRKLLEQQK